MKWKCFLCLSLLCGSALAQTDVEIDERWKDAQKRLNDAAKELAELSSERLDMQGLFAKLNNRRAVLGVNIDSNKEGEVEEGVRILAVSPGGPADEAGLEAGDVLLSLNHSKLLDDDKSSAVEKLLNYMGDVEPGDTVSVEYLRGKQIRSVEITAEQFSPSRVLSFSGSGLPGRFEFNTGKDFELVFPDGIGALTFGPWGELRLVTLSKDLGEYFGVEEGLLVVHAPEDNNLQLRDGDVILSIDKRRPADPRHAIRILRSYRPGEQVNLKIVRKKKEQSLELELPQRSASNRDRRYFFSPED